MITKQVSPVAYHLALSPTWTIHDVFHASLLTPYHETKEHGVNYNRPPSEMVDGEEEYEVEAIMGHHFFGQGCKLQYLVWWKGYSAADNMWEPEEQVFAPKLREAYHCKHPKDQPFPHKRSLEWVLLGIPLTSLASTCQTSPAPPPVNPLEPRPCHSRSALHKAQEQYLVKLQGLKKFLTRWKSRSTLRWSTVFPPQNHPHSCGQCSPLYKPSPRKASQMMWPDTSQGPRSTRSSKRLPTKKTPSPNCEMRSSTFEPDTPPLPSSSVPLPAPGASSGTWAPLALRCHTVGVGLELTSSTSPPMTPRVSRELWESPTLRST